MECDLGSVHYINKLHYLLYYFNDLNYIQSIIVITKILEFWRYLMTIITFSSVITCYEICTSCNKVWKDIFLLSTIKMNRHLKTVPSTFPRRKTNKNVSSCVVNDTYQSRQTKGLWTKHISDNMKKMCIS